MYKVVLVEDERILLEGLRLTTPWAAHGFQVVGCAENAAQARSLILSLRPDLVITDIRLPEVSGLELIESLTERIMCDYVIISGYDHFDYAKKALSLGVRAYLLKPVDDEELKATLDKLREIIDRRKEIERTLPELPSMPEPSPGAEDSLSVSLGQQYANAARQYMAAHFQEDLTVQKVAAALYISESYLSKLIRNCTGLSFHDTLIQYRMQAACRLLRDRNKKVYQIAHAVGFRDVQHFTQQFRRKMGCTPTVYRQRAGTGNSV